MFKFFVICTFFLVHAFSNNHEIKLSNLTKISNTTSLLSPNTSLITSTSTYPGVTWSNIETLNTALIDLINSATKAGEHGRFLIGQIVRLSFHDCVGNNGCDGCINMNLPDNGGLYSPIGYLELLYNNTEYNFNTIMSRSDFWAISATLTLLFSATVGVKPVNQFIPNMPIYYGRIDCETSPYTTSQDILPDARHDGEYVINYFESNFSFTTRETIALMGAHTLGQMRNEDVGFHGVWDANKDTLNNEYYTMIIDANRGYYITSANPKQTRYQWDVTNTSGGCTFCTMLDVDIGLYLDLKDYIIKYNGDVQGCDYSTCPLYLPGVHNVMDFAQNNTLWLIEFANVWDKMIKKGWVNCLVEINENSHNNHYLANCTTNNNNNGEIEINNQENVEVV